MSDEIETETGSAEPRRLGGDLLSSGRGDAPSPAARARIAGALGLGVGAAATAASAKAAAATATTTKAAAASTTTAVTAKIAGIGLWTKVVGVAAVTLAVGGGAVVASRSDPAIAAGSAESIGHGATASSYVATPSYDSARARHDEIPPPEPAGRSEETIAATAPPGSSPASAGGRSATSDPASAGGRSATLDPASAGGRSATLDPASAGGRSATSDPPATAASGPSPLAREVRAIDTARTALASGDARASLSALDAHDREFPSGPMKTEADVLRVDALEASGDHAGAKRLATSLLARDPAGAHARHLRAVIGTTEK